MLIYLFIFRYVFIYLFWLCWVFVSVRGLSLVAASGGHSSSRCVGLSLSRPLLLRSTSSRCAGSVVVAHGPSCSAARGILPDQGSNLHPPHWQVDSQPLCHQGSPLFMLTDLNNVGWDQVHWFALYALAIYCSYSWFYVFLSFNLHTSFLSGWSTVLTIYLPLVVRFFFFHIFSYF